MADKKRRYAADEYTDAGQHHRKRDVQPGGERVNRADDDEKRRDDEGCARDRMHRANSLFRRGGSEIRAALV
jgi:hypothetical protein